MVKKEGKKINMVYLTVTIFVSQFFAIEYSKTTQHKKNKIWHCDIIVSLYPYVNEPKIDYIFQKTRKHAQA